ncbi:complement C1r-A subcomponent-like [Chaetodon auriga]|uniref:complement C1r-A subcomponent-like n=1 Tax=Chaetodon auriga TaxID=39042 RepID=UPI00403302D4
MGWTFCIIWFLYVSVGECRRLPEPEPLMHGEVHSPQYPQPYPPNLLEQWDLSVPEGYQIRLTFTHLDIEASAGCHYDALTVLYGDEVLGKFCGHENSADGNHPGSHPMLSPGNKLTLIFQTDDNNPERHQNVGFSAQYQAIDIDECAAPEPLDGSGPLCSQICLNTLGSYLCSCHHGFELRSDQRTCLLSCNGGIFDEPEGHLFSPGYPNPPLHAVSCQYIISVESGFTVSLNFTDNFHIESVDTQQGASCPHHWLQVTIPGQEPMKLCGGESPGLIDTNSNRVTLEYHTDDEGLSNGWSMDYTTHRVKCPFPGNIAKGRVMPFLTEYLYRDYIYARCDQGYKLMMNGQEIKSFSTMCQNNGQWHLPLPECHISFTCEADRKWRSNNDVVFSPTCIPVCGQPTKLISAYQRIIGGREAPDDTIPWQVLLSVDGQRAGGMVIADRWIMTAAHVLTHNGIVASNQTVRIYMGLTDVKTLQNSPLFAASVHVHPGYKNPSGLDFNNDIALIKMQDSITFNSSIMPICLPAEGATYTTGMMGLVSGFGLTEIDKRRILTNKLKYVQLPVVDQETCTDSITVARKTKDSVPNLTNNMFCAGVPEGGKDSCQGDSGGPFTLSDDGRFWAAGIVSWGVDCGRQGTYGVYTKVTNYLNWINQTMQEN